MNADSHLVPSGSYVVPPVQYQQLPPPPRPGNGQLTLQGVLDNQVVKLLAGILLAVSMAYVSMTVSRIEDRLEVSEVTDEKHNSRIDGLEKWQVEQRFIGQQQAETSGRLLDALVVAAEAIKGATARAALAVEAIAGIGEGGELVRNRDMRRAKRQLRGELTDD